MAIFKKTKKEETEVVEKFKIPQIAETYEGLKTSHPKFEAAEIGSVFFGTQVKDEVVFDDNKGKVNVHSGYDAFREKEEKHIKEEDLIKKYGTKWCILVY